MGDGQVAHELLDAAFEKAREGAVEYIECRHPIAIGQDLPAGREKVSMVLHLVTTAAELWRQLCGNGEAVKGRYKPVSCPS